MRRAPKLMLAISSVAAFFFCQASLSPTQAGSNPKIVEAAKSEGAVSYYTTMTLSQSKKVVDKFQEKYPFIKPELFRGGGDEVLNRIQNEARGGLNAWDVVSTRGDSVLTFRECQANNALPLAREQVHRQRHGRRRRILDRLLCEPLCLRIQHQDGQKRGGSQNLRTAPGSQVEGKKDFH